MSRSPARTAHPLRDAQRGRPRHRESSSLRLPRRASNLKPVLGGLRTCRPTSEIRYTSTTRTRRRDGGMLSNRGALDVIGRESESAAVGCTRKPPRQCKPLIACLCSWNAQQSQRDGAELSLDRQGKTSAAVVTRMGFAIETTVDFTSGSFGAELGDRFGDYWPVGYDHVADQSPVRSIHTITEPKP